MSFFISASYNNDKKVENIKSRFSKAINVFDDSVLKCINNILKKKNYSTKKNLLVILNIIYIKKC